MIKADDARAAFDSIGKENPTRWIAAVQTFVVDALETNEKLSAENDKLKALLDETNRKLDLTAKGAFLMSQDFKAVMERLKIRRKQAAAAPPPEEEAPTDAGEGDTEIEAPIAPASTVGDAGEPRSPEQMETESAMDAAIAAAELEKRRNGGGAAVPHAAAPAHAAGAPRTPGSRPRGGVPPVKPRRAPASAATAPIPVEEHPATNGAADPEETMNAAIAAMDKQ
jgi:hypothetical protein